MYRTKKKKESLNELIVPSYEFVSANLLMEGNARFEVWIIKCKNASIKWRLWWSSQCSFDASWGPGDFQTLLTNGVSRFNSKKASIWEIQNERPEHKKFITLLQFVYGSGTYIFSVTITLACCCVQIVNRKCKKRNFQTHLYFVICPRFKTLRFRIWGHKNSILGCKFCFWKSCVKTWHFYLVVLNITFETMKFASPNAYFA